MLKTAGLFVFVTAMIGTSACNRQNETRTVRGREVHLLHSSVALPLDATSIYLEEGGALDAYQAVRFDTSLKNARMFTTELTGSEPRLDTWSFPSTFSAEWWVNDSKKAEGSTTHTSQGNRITVIIDSISGERARVWVEIFET